MRGNSGLIGSARQANVSSSPGIWSVTDHQVSKGGGNWPTGAPPASTFMYDANAANLFIALPLTDYQSATTGGFYSDVSPLIRTEFGLSAGTAKTASQNGNGSASSSVASPFTQYSTNLLVNTQSSQSQLYYYSYQLGNNQALTIEFWAYFPSSGYSGNTFLATNNFGGGYYDGWNIYRDGSTSKAKYFTNSGGSQYIGENVISLNDTWAHIAYVFDGTGSSYKQFVNGTMYETTYHPDAGRSIFTIGATNWDGINNNANLRFQDWRIYTGIQKYTSSFTVDKNDVSKGGRILV